MNVSDDLVVKDINDILNESFKEDRALVDDIISSLERTAVEQIKLGKVIKIPYIGNYSYNKVYLNLREHHKELKDFRRTTDIQTYKSHVRQLVSDTKAKVAEEVKTDLYWTKFRKKYNKKFYDLATKFGLLYAKIWLQFKANVSIVPFDKDVQYMYDMLNEKS